MTLPETRLTVTLISASKPYRCCTEQIIEVACKYQSLSDQECRAVVKLCGFYGQDIEVKSRRWEDAHTLIAVVRVFCDSGD